MKKLDIILHLARRLHNQGMSLGEFTVLLALHQGKTTQQEIAEYLGKEKRQIAGHITALLLHGEIETKALKRGKTPATYGLADRGIDIIMSTIPANPEP